MRARLRARRGRWGWALLLLLATPWAGCDRKRAGAPPVDLQWALTPDPPAVGHALVSLALTDTTAARPVSGARVRLEGNMTHPGMKPSFATAREVAPGRYEATIELTMAGDWFLRIEAALADGREWHRQIEISVSGAR